MKALEIENLRITYPATKGIKVAVEDFSLSVEEGEFFGMLGPNGAGKTSIISAITGLVDPERGNLKVFGHRAGTKEAKRLVGCVPQELISYGFFNVEEILNFHLGYFGLPKNPKRIEELMERLQLSEHRKKLVSQLSGGMKRRLLIAKSLLHEPKLLLMDEPSAGVDIELRAILWDFMNELNRKGTTILLTTHYLEEAQRLCRKVAILDLGRLLALDETGSLISSLSPRILELKLKPEFSHREFVRPQREDIYMLKKEGDELKVTLSSRLSLKDTFESLGIRLEEIQDVRTQEGDLEQAFLSLLKKGRRT